MDAVKLLLIGCGKMGGAMLAGWLAQGVRAENVVVVDSASIVADLWGAKGIKVCASVDQVGDFQPHVVLLAVKPQQMDAVAANCRAWAQAGALVLSIAAGKTLGYFDNHLGEGAKIVRAMPNTPAAVSRGITVLVANARVEAKDRKLAGDLLSAVGEVAWVDDEALLDAVTALSGGGPAYVFLLIECLAEAGIAAGLPRELAERLARVTVAGSGELVHQASESPAQLRTNVTSPAGTTLEALSVLMAPDGLAPLMTKAIAAATRRSKELAG